MRQTTSTPKVKRSRPTVPRPVIQEVPWYEELGRSAGGALAKGAASLFRSLTGFGDYQIQTNSLLAEATEGRLGNQVPIIRNSPGGNIIRHREFLGNIRGSTLDFNVTTFDLNPGLDEIFPWGYVLANSYTTYRLRGMVAEFISLSSEFTGQPYLGYVAMATQYNSLDPVYTNKKLMQNSEFACSGKPSKDLMHPIECARDQLVTDHLYVRSGDVPQNADIRLYDVGRLSVATGGQATNTIIGELWISYEIEYFQPKLGASEGALINAVHFRGNSANDTYPLNNPVKQNGGTMAFTVQPNGVCLFEPQLSSGEYFVSYVSLAPTAGATSRAPTIQGLGSCALIPNSFSSFGSYRSDAYNGAQFSLGRVRITGSGANFSFGNGSGYGSTWDLYIVQTPTVLQRVDRSHILVDDQTAYQIKRQELDEWLGIETIKRSAKRISEKLSSSSSSDEEGDEDYQQQINDLMAKVSKLKLLTLKDRVTHEQL